MPQRKSKHRGGRKARTYEERCGYVDKRDPAYIAGQRAALEGMDLPDGAYFAMADEFGIEP